MFTEPQAAPFARIVEAFPFDRVTVSLFMVSRMSGSPASVHENAAAFPASAKNRPTAPATVARSHAVRRLRVGRSLMLPLPGPWVAGEPTGFPGSPQDASGVGPAWGRGRAGKPRPYTWGGGGGGRCRG